jgi:hypothetical protein
VGLGTSPHPTPVSLLAGAAGPVHSYERRRRPEGGRGVGGSQGASAKSTKLSLHTAVSNLLAVNWFNLKT